MAGYKAQVHLRKVITSDLPVFFEHQLTPAGNHMAAFTAKDPTNRTAFNQHWAKIQANNSILIRTILHKSHIAGYILSHNSSGQPQLTYWLGQAYWGKGIATAALQQFLTHQKHRPLQAKVAQDNPRSLRVLQKCGFAITAEDSGFANARNKVIKEFILTLDN